MHDVDNYRVNPGLRLLLTDAGVGVENVLRRAALPQDLFGGGTVQLAPDRYFRLWQAIEVESGDPLLPIRIGRSISIEAFDPVIFAALCSRNLNLAAERVSTFKRLIGPMRLIVSPTSTHTTLEVRWPDSIVPPPSLATAELVFIVALARLATRTDVRPLSVTSPFPPQNVEPYNEYFGVPVTSAREYSVTFTAVDASRPFLTVNEPMWESFEPQLRTRIAHLDRESSVPDRVRSALVELLPMGRGTIGAVAGELAISTRSLQRQLQGEGTNFQEVLSQTREALARHYLTQQAMSTQEIALLLGYDDPRSFYRAFNGWTGLTPLTARLQAV